MLSQCWVTTAEQRPTNLGLNQSIDKEEVRSTGEDQATRDDEIGVGRIGPRHKLHPHGNAEEDHFHQDVGQLEEGTARNDVATAGQEDNAYHGHKDDNHSQANRHVGEVGWKVQGLKPATATYREFVQRRKKVKWVYVNNQERVLLTV